MSEERGLKKMGLIGYPVAHSLSPVMHAAAYEELDLPWRYGLHDVPTPSEAERFIEQAAFEGFSGLNVTMPYKRLALTHATVTDPAARGAGGANVLTFCDGEVFASNTDGSGIVAALAGEGGLPASGASFLVCGTGPTAGAACTALIASGASLVFCMSRSVGAARRFVSGLSLDRAVPTTYGEASDIMAQVDGIVDATPVGMQAGDVSVLPAAGFSSRHVVLDMVYGHGVTDLVRVASQAGARTLDGVGVLVEQAALTIEIWAEVHEGVALRAPREAMRDAALSELVRRTG